MTVHENEQSREIGDRLETLGYAWIGAIVYDSLMSNPLNHKFFIELRGEVMALEERAASRERERVLREIVRAAAVLARNVAEVPNHGATDYTVSPSLLMELRAALADTPALGPPDGIS